MTSPSFTENSSESAATTSGCRESAPMTGPSSMDNATRGERAGRLVCEVTSDFFCKMWPVEWLNFTAPTCLCKACETHSLWMLLIHRLIHAEKNLGNGIILLNQSFIAATPPPPPAAPACAPGSVRPDYHNPLGYVSCGFHSSIRFTALQWCLFDCFDKKKFHLFSRIQIISTK